MFDFNYKNESIYFQNQTKHTHPEEYAMIAKSDIKMLWMKLSTFPPKGCTTPFWEILSKTEYLEFCNVKSAMTLTRNEHVPTVPHYIAEGLIEGTWCRGIYVSLVDLTHNTPIFFSSKQWWIGMCSVYLGVWYATMGGHYCDSLSYLWEHFNNIQ